MELTEWGGKPVKVAPKDIKFPSTWLWSSFSNLWRAYKIIVEIHTQQNSPQGIWVLINREARPVTLIFVSTWCNKGLPWNGLTNHVAGGGVELEGGDA